MDTQNSGPNVYAAHSLSDEIVRQSYYDCTKSLVDGLEEPLQALIDTSASNNFDRAQVMTGHGVNLPNMKEEMIAHLANGSRLEMPKQVICLAMKFEVSEVKTS
ncbi:uncharacterized protein PHALS_04670 [Plasmopara halstedii]|uniref:Uncharacterized protein n=1 Tax=Plasmopara halstedii TaxID=4781 RepID=A0A0N7L3Z2_PLAHL|nr:uncharacterized protein PHALS_04670 [Plasmopara halstedii]CEG37227.1 hypothetical protein PHALS_04670 [Plasmopara halstedii]|eukprot:XP_024573596.1 hypothetical protein PHALS_04670 [Plasmopara halstedii]